MKKSSDTRMRRLMYFRILCYVLQKWIRIQHQILFGKNSWVGSKIHHNAELWTIDGEPMEFKWNIFPGFTTMQLVDKVQEFMNKMGDPAQFQGRMIFMSMFNDIKWWTTDNEKECIANATLVSLFAKRFPAGRWSFLGTLSSTTWSPWKACATPPRGVTTPTTSPPPSQKCVKNNESFHDRTGQPVVGGQSSSSFVPSVIKTDVPLNNDDLARKDLLLPQYGERIEKSTRQIEQLLYGCRIPECCWNRDSTSWRRTLRNSHNSQMQWPVVSTLCQETKKHLKPVLEVTTCCLQGKYGVDIRIMSVSEDNSHSWVRISHGLNKLVTDLIDKEYDDNEQETSETKTEAFALKTDVLALASRSKAKAKPRRPTSACSSTWTVPIGERTWTDVEPGAQSNQAYPVAKNWTLLFVTENYLEKKMVRSKSGDWKMIFGINLSTLSIGMMKCGRARWQEAEATRKDFNIVLSRQDKQFFISELFKVIQDVISLILHYRTMW